MRNSLRWAILGCLLLGSVCGQAESVEVCPAPADEELSKDFTVEVAGKAVPVYVAKVAPADRERRCRSAGLGKLLITDWFNGPNHGCSISRN